MNADQLFAQLGNLAEMDSGSQIVMGSVGWEDDDVYFDLGDQNNEGHTLVRVQLYTGRDITKPLNPSRAQGHKILCHLSTEMFRIPKKDTRVFVAIPKGMETAPGAGVIFAAIETDHRYNLTDGSIQIATRNGSGNVVVKNDGSVTLFTTADNTDNGQSVYFRVANDGFQFTAPWGQIKFDPTGFHINHGSGATLDMGGIYGLPSPMDTLASYFKAQAAVIDGRCSLASFGPGGGLAAPLAGASEVIAALAALQVQIETFNGALTGFLAANPGPVIGSALGGALAAVDTAMSGEATIVGGLTGPTSPLPKATSSA